MLVLARQRGDSIIITCPSGDIIKVSVSDIVSGSKVRIGIEADRSYQIDREEIYEQKKAEGKIPAKPLPATTG